MEQKTLKCKTCPREAGKRDFCLLHLKAYENIVKKYDFWRKALKISWKEYLSEIEQNSLTGEWAKEVASYLINNEEIRIVKEI
ncbi:MAG: hypothetical protein JSW44_03470 [Candidatus Bathyarchaeota archaeon]|nr:MAG: hypothetical protein JSW44_03470 [Candidatus Bathyarchaeota archaeon]